MIRIHHVTRADEKACFTLIRTADGFYSFGEEQECWGEVPGIGPYAYWTTTYTSGLYDDLAAAERDAKAALGWLRSSGMEWSSDA